MIIGFMALKVAACVVSTYANGFIVFAIARFALGVGNSGVYLGAFVLGMYFILPSSIIVRGGCWRVTCSISIWASSMCI